MIVYKYPIHIQPSEQVLMLPRAAKILAFQTQNDQPFIWALVDREATDQPRHFRVVGTGHEIVLDGMSYVGTIQQGPFVWHLWEIPT